MRALGLTSTLALAVLVACGGSDDADLYKPGTGGSGATSGSGGTTPDASAGAAGGGGAAAGGGVSGGGAGGAGAGGDGGPAGAGGDGGSAGASGSGGGGGTGGIPPQPGVGSCGAQLCSFELGASCCVSSTKGLYCANSSRGNPCSCNQIGCNTLQIRCDGPEDCPSGQVCCAETGVIGPGYDTVQCRSECITGFVGSKREVCHPGGTPCKSGNPCQPDPQLPPGYASCQS